MALAVPKLIESSNLSFASEECCCTKVLLDGCIAEENGEDIVIAKCTNIVNATYANCTWAMEGHEFSNQPVDCLIDGLDNMREGYLLDFRIPLFLGISIYLAAQLIGIYQEMKERKTHEKRSTNALTHLSYAYIFFQPSGSSRLFGDLGISLIILGLTMNIYETSFWAIYLFVAVPSTATIIILILKYHFYKSVKIREETDAPLMSPSYKELNANEEKKSSPVAPVTNVQTTIARSLREMTAPQISPTQEEEQESERLEVTSSIDLGNASREFMAMVATNQRSNTHLTEIESEEVAEFKAVDVYQDFTTPFPRLIVTFVAQVSLLFIYIYTVYKEDKPEFSDLNAFLYYGLGALVQVVHNKTKGRERYLYDHYWLESTLHFRKYFGRMHGTWLSKKILAFHLYLRVLFSFSIDLAGRDLIILLLPLHLAQSDNAMDFVLNAVAAYFITELDDLGEPREIGCWKDEFRNLKKSYGGTLEHLRGINSSFREIYTPVMNMNHGSGDEEDQSNDESAVESVQEDETEFEGIDEDIKGDIPNIYRKSR
jgi:hypothetical protein